MKTLFINWFRLKVLNRRVECKKCAEEMQVIMNMITAGKPFTVSFTPLVKRKEIIHWCIKLN